MTSQVDATSPPPGSSTEPLHATWVSANRPSEPEPEPEAGQSQRSPRRSEWWVHAITVGLPASAVLAAAGCVLLPARDDLAALRPVMHGGMLATATVTIGYTVAALSFDKRQWNSRGFGRRLWRVAMGAALGWLVLAAGELALAVMAPLPPPGWSVVGAGVHLAAVIALCAAVATTTTRARAPIALGFIVVGVLATALTHEPRSPLALTLKAAHTLAALLWAGNLFAVLQVGMWPTMDHRKRRLVPWIRRSFVRIASGAKVTDRDGKTLDNRLSSSAFAAPDADFVRAVNCFSQRIAYPAFWATLLTGLTMWLQLAPDWTTTAHDLFSTEWAKWAAVKAAVTGLALSGLAAVHRFGTVPALNDACNRDEKPVPGLVPATAGKRFLIFVVLEALLMVFLIGVAAGMTSIRPTS